MAARRRADHCALEDNVGVVVLICQSTAKSSRKLLDVICVQAGRRLHFLSQASVTTPPCRSCVKRARSVVPDRPKTLTAKGLGFSNALLVGLSAEAIILSSLILK